MREQHWDATHNVYAYCIREGNLMRYSDDGEPQGTSGMPTLRVFTGQAVTNVCCVVTRYFGGVLLGTGGLARAYSHTAALALEAAGISLMQLWKRVLFACSYSQFESVRGELAACGGVAEETDYGADVLITALVPADACDTFCARLLDRTAGTVAGEIVGETFRAIPLARKTDGGTAEK